MPTTAVAKAKKNEMIDPSLLSDLQNEFRDSLHVRNELIKIPRLKLNNPLSDDVQSGLAKAGEFSINVRNKNFGNGVTIIPLWTGENTSLLSREGDIVCVSQNLITNQDGKKCKECPHNQYWNDWGTKGNRKIPECKVSINMIVLIQEGDSLNESDLAEINLRKTNYKAGKAIVNLMINDPLKVPFGTKYTIHSKQESSGKNTYHVVDSHKIDVSRCTKDELNFLIPVARKVMEWKRNDPLAHDRSAKVREPEAHNQDIKQADSEVPY